MEKQNFVAQSDLATQLVLGSGSLIKTFQIIWKFVLHSPNACGRYFYMNP